VEHEHCCDQWLQGNYKGSSLKQVGNKTYFLLTGLKQKEPGSSPLLYKTIKLAVFGTLTIHFIACFWFGLACSRMELDFDSNMCSNDSWLILVSSSKDTATCL